MSFGFVKWGPRLEAGLTIASLPFGSLLGLFLLGTLDRGANARGALAGMIAGLAVILCVFRFTNVAFTVVRDDGLDRDFCDWRRGQPLSASDESQEEKAPT